jgi:DNA repair photolyase
MVNTSILKPSKTGFAWCINQYGGCSHGCKYCYGMTMRRKKYEDWLKVKPRKDVIQSLEKDIKKLTKNSVTIKDIFLGSITDSYQPIEYTNKLTRQIVEVLKQNELPFTILTKNDLVLRDIDLFRDYKWCRIGVTITSLNNKLRTDLEPFSANYDARIHVLELLKANNISTYLCCEPILPVKESNPIEIVTELMPLVDLFEFGMWSKYRKQGIPKYYYKDYSDEYYLRVFKEIIDFCETQHVNYCIALHSKDFIEKHGLPFKPYPFVRA